MIEKRISHCQGKGSLTHNNRKISAKNVGEACAELDKAAKKKVKFDEIEGIEAKESVFGKKVTLIKAQGFENMLRLCERADICGYGVRVKRFIC